jgi:geranylgeranyl diphosphate synthase type II
MYTFDELVSLTRRSLDGLSLPAEPRMLYRPIRDALDAGGKRVRPLLALSCCGLFSDDVPAAVPAAMGIEVFHNFTLLHDDIMDRADRRRGRETVHVKWNENVAILSGDAMLIYAYELFSQSDPERMAALFPVFNRVVMGVCEGQSYDMVYETRLDVTVGEYLMMIERKTAILIAGAARIGAVSGGADEAAAEALYEAGMNLGMAFQLQDDLLDTYGDPEVFGKNLGGDIASNKKTFLLIKALELSEGATRRRLLALISDAPADRQAKFEAARAIYDETGARALAESLRDDYYDRAVAIIDRLPVENGRKEPLRAVCRLFVDREK